MYIDIYSKFHFPKGTGARANITICGTLHRTRRTGAKACLTIYKTDSNDLEDWSKSLYYDIYGRPYISKRTGAKAYIIVYTVASKHREDWRQNIYYIIYGKPLHQDYWRQAIYYHMCCRLHFKRKTGTKTYTIMYRTDPTSPGGLEPGYILSYI